MLTVFCLFQPNKFIFIPYHHYLHLDVILFWVPKRSYGALWYDQNLLSHIITPSLIIIMLPKNWNSKVRETFSTVSLWLLKQPFFSLWSLTFILWVQSLVIGRNNVSWRNYMIANIISILSPLNCWHELEKWLHCIDLYYKAILSFTKYVCVP